MSKNKSNGGAVAEAAVVETAAPVAQFEIQYRRDHPKTRCSYGIKGNSGIIVFDMALFAGFGQPGFQPPATITLSCPMVLPKADNREEREALKAAKAAKKAAKAAERIAAQEAKAAERKAKAEALLAKAQEKAAAAAAATAAATAPTEG